MKHGHSLIVLATGVSLAQLPREAHGVHLDFDDGTQNAPIGVEFTSDVSAVTVRAIDVGVSGARIKAYDADGGLLGGDTHFGTGVGSNQFVDLTIEAAGIRRLEMFQPTTGQGDGIAFDDLQFTLSPVATETRFLGALKALFR